MRAQPVQEDESRQWLLRPIDVERTIATRSAIKRNLEFLLQVATRAKSSLLVRTRRLQAF